MFPTEENLCPKIDISGNEEAEVSCFYYQVTLEFTLPLSLLFAGSTFRQKRSCEKDLPMFDATPCSMLQAKKSMIQPNFEPPSSLNQYLSEYPCLRKLSYVNCHMWVILFIQVHVIFNNSTFIITVHVHVTCIMIDFLFVFCSVRKHGQRHFWRRVSEMGT